MLYRILYPTVVSIDSDSIKNAIKNYVKLNDSININLLILSENEKYYKASLKKRYHDIRNRVGIDIYPCSPAIISTLPIITIPKYIN
jgi:hypothetical protein